MDGALLRVMKYSQVNAWLNDGVSRQLLLRETIASQAQPQLPGDWHQCEKEAKLEKQQRLSHLELRLHPGWGTRARLESGQKKLIDKQWLCWMLALGSHSNAHRRLYRKLN